MGTKKEPQLSIDSFNVEQPQPDRSQFGGSTRQERRTTHQAAPITRSRLMGSVMSIKVVLFMRGPLAVGFPA
jgi:hypothetical protein